MKIPKLLKSGLFFCSSAAGIALAVKACLEISDHRWPAGLGHAGWSIYLVLLPFLNYSALKTVAVRRLSIENATNPKLQLLPGNLGFVGLLGLMLVIAGDIAGALG